MRKQRLNLLLAVVVSLALVGGLGWLVFRNQEPVYQGKRLSEWLSPTNGVLNAAQQQAVRQIGTNGIPTLLRMLRAHDSKLKLKLVGLARNQHVIKVDFISAIQRNWEATEAFVILGTAASNAVPALIQIVEQNISSTSLMAAENALRFVGPTATGAVPVLVRTADNTDAQVRGTAVSVLGDLHAEPELVLPVLIKSLKDSDPFVRKNTLVALGKFGPEAKVAVPALFDFLKNQQPLLSGNVYWSLKQIDPGAAAKADIK